MTLDFPLNAPGAVFALDLLLELAQRLARLLLPRGYLEEPVLLRLLLLDRGRELLEGLRLQLSKRAEEFVHDVGQCGIVQQLQRKGVDAAGRPLAGRERVVDVAPLGERVGRGRARRDLEPAPSMTF